MLRIETYTHEALARNKSKTIWRD